MKNKGITLIALVITIIVLLILAGVVIATLTGDNGLITKAKDASTQSESKKNEEIERLDTYVDAIDNYTDNTNKITLSATNISYEDFINLGNNVHLYVLTANVAEQYQNLTLIWEIDSPDTSNLFFDQVAGNEARIELIDEIDYGDISITVRIENTNESATCILDTSSGRKEI